MAQSYPGWGQPRVRFATGVKADASVGHTSMQRQYCFRHFRGIHRFGSISTFTFGAKHRFGSISTFAFGSISRFGVRSVFTFGSIDDTQHT